MYILSICLFPWPWSFESSALSHFSNWPSHLLLQIPLSTWSIWPGTLPAALPIGWFPFTPVFSGHLVVQQQSMFYLLPHSEGTICEPSTSPTPLSVVIRDNHAAIEWTEALVNSGRGSGHSNVSTGPAYAQSWMHHFHLALGQHRCILMSILSEWEQSLILLSHEDEKRRIHSPHQWLNTMYLRHVDLC